MAVKVKQHKGAWWVFIDHKGKRKAKRVGTSKKAAEDVAGKIQAKIALGQFEIKDEEEQAPLLRDYAKQWLETYAKVHCKPATAHNYDRDYRLHIDPALGNRRLTAITRQDIKRLIAEKRNSDLSWSSVKNIIIPLREMLFHATEDGIIAANPATRVGKLNKKPADRRQNINPLTRDELRLFLDTARQYAPRFAPFLLWLVQVFGLAKRLRCSGETSTFTVAFWKSNVRTVIEADRYRVQRTEKPAVSI
jgi:integrase